MLFVKPKGLKYTDMAIYIDANIKNISETDKNPEIEEKVFKYIYLIIHALACKQKYFYTTEDYDNYSIYAAEQMYMILKKNYNNQGTIKQGKKVVLIKSSLNYIKALMYPAKVDYQQKYFTHVFTSGIKGFDEDNMLNILHDDIQDDYKEDILSAINYEFKNISTTINDILDNSLYSKNSVIRNHLYTTCLLNLNRTLWKVKLDINKNKNYKGVIRHLDKNKQDICLWCLDNSYQSYVSILLERIKNTINYKIEDTKSYYSLDTNVLDYILDSNYSNIIPTKDNGGE